MIGAANLHPALPSAERGVVFYQREADVRTCSSDKFRNSFLVKSAMRG